MIPFFRKIRKKMADDNKPMKYMRYAIGEIALVVIGILIALSINNWNEAQKEKEILDLYLYKITKELAVDQLFLESENGSANRQVDYLENLSKGNYDKVDLTNLFIILSKNSGELRPSNSYISIEQQGMVNKINDQSTIKILNLYYNVYCPDYNDWVNYHQNSVWNNIEGVLLEKLTAGYGLKVDRESALEILENESLKSYINLQLYSYRRIGSTSLRTLEKTKEAKAKIEAYLKSQ